jgi:membrane protease YdiL (CAAX protease family)
VTIRPTLSDPADDRAGVLRTLLSGIHPLRLAVLISIVDVVIVLAAAVVFRIAIPSMSPLTSALVVTALLSVLVPLAVWKISGFREAGFTGPREWRNLHLLLVPALLAVVPVLAGFRPVDALATLIVGYALTGFMEEALWRGLVLRVLRPIGPLAAALYGSMLFGAAHLVNVMFRDSVALVAAQAFGAACFGVGYAAVAMRIGTIWPLMVLHTLTDLFAAVGALPKIPILVGQDIVLLVFGLWLLHTPAKPGPTSMNQRRRRARGIDRAAGGA